MRFRPECEDFQKLKAFVQVRNSHVVPLTLREQQRGCESETKTNQKPAGCDGLSILCPEGQPTTERNARREGQVSHAHGCTQLPLPWDFQKQLPGTPRRTALCSIKPCYNHRSCAHFYPKPSPWVVKAEALWSVAQKTA